MEQRPVGTTGFGGRPLAYIDLEFTGLNPAVHDITEIAILKPSWSVTDVLPPTDPEVVPGWSAWVRKVWPTNLDKAAPYALELNGFDAAIWRQESIALHHALASVAELLHEVNIIGHNVSLDVEFLQEGFRRCSYLGIRAPDLKYRIDTTTLIWEHLVPLGLTKGNLADACTVLGVSNEGAHTALADVLRTKGVAELLRMMPRHPHLLQGGVTQTSAFARIIVDRITHLEANRG